MSVLAALLRGLLKWLLERYDAFATFIRTPAEHELFPCPRHDKVHGRVCGKDRLREYCPHCGDNEPL